MNIKNMTGEALDNKENLWPLPKLRFIVEFEGGATVSFQEISDLDNKAKVIEYTHGDSPKFSFIKIPELKNTADVILKKGMYLGDNELFNWFNKIKSNTIKCQAGHSSRCLKMVKKLKEILELINELEPTDSRLLNLYLILNCLVFYNTIGERLLTDCCLIQRQYPYYINKRIFTYLKKRHLEALSSIFYKCVC